MKRSEDQTYTDDWSQIVDQLHESILVADLKGQITAWNRGAELLLGWTGDEMRGQHVGMMYANPDALMDRERFIGEVLERGNYEFEAKLKKKSGELFDGLVMLSLLRHNDGTPKGVIGNTRDISARKKTEESLRKGNEDLERLVRERTQELSSTLETLVEGVITADETGTIESFNPSAEVLFGYSAAEVVGQNLSILMPDKDKNSHAGHMERYLQTGEAFIIGVGRELLGQHKNGSNFPIWLSVGEMVVGGKRKFVGSIYDISDRKLMEQEAEESRVRMGELRRHLEDAIESIKDGFMLFDKDDRLVLCNSALKKEFQVAVEYMKPGTLFEDFIRAVYSVPELAAPDYRTEEVIQRRIALHRHPEKVTPKPIQMQTGRWVIAHEFETRDGGRVLVRTDVSKEVEADQEIVRAKEAAEEASNAKSGFLSSMSHELRTPMNAILGYAQLLEQDAAAPHKDYVDEILRSGHHMIDLINGVLDLAKIESGTVSFEMAHLSPGPLMEACVSMMKASAEENQIRVRSVIPDADLPTIKIDPLRFKQALLNLLSNGIKYNRPDGEVVLECSSGENGIFHVAVTDTGPGIPEEMHDKVFEPFDRLGAEASNIPGTGIGLTVTRQLIEGMAGTVGFQSNPGEGTTFWINLPVS